MSDAWDAAGRVRWPDGNSEFEAHAAACRAGGALDAHAGEVALAWAAARGDAAAIRELDALVAGDIDAAARKIDPRPAFVDEVRQAVRVRLLVGDDGAPRLAAYGGRGPLRGWVGVAALRVALNHKRGAAAPVAAEEVLAEVVAREPDPELRVLKTTYRAELREALEAALAALPERQRAVLRLTFVDGMRLHQVARLYKVHESTVSRWVSQATEAVADDTRRRLVGRLAVSPGTADSVARMVLSNLDLSIARILGEPG